MTKVELNEILDSFLNRWDLDAVEAMTLKDYVSVGNKDTFCQWVETKTKMLGSIKGMTSIKFGIYERKKPNKKPKNYTDDDKYSWLRAYGSNRAEAFQNTKRDILKIIQHSEKGDFSKIDHIIMPDLFKWKVAFLYSNERLIPIFKRDVLFKIANHFGSETNRNTKISEIQEIMIANKPANQTVYQFMGALFDKFGREKDKEEILGKTAKQRKEQTRRGTTNRNVKPQIRTCVSSYIAEQKHNKIQELLKERLIEEFGEMNVILEENYVDVKVIQPNFLDFYEVKSASYASDCVKEALGQVLLYTHNDNDKRKKRIYVVGQYPANEQDKSYIGFIKSILNIDFEYLEIKID